MKYWRLGDLLVSSKMITSKQLEEALEIQKTSGKGHRLGTVLIENGFITENQLIETLQMQLGVEFIDLNNTSIPPEMASVLPKNIAKKHMVIPVKVSGNDLYLAMVDPLNPEQQPVSGDGYYKASNDNGYMIEIVHKAEVLTVYMTRP